MDVTVGSAMSLEAVQRTSKEVLQAKNQNLVSHLCKHYKKAGAHAKSDGKLIGGRWLFYEA